MLYAPPAPAPELSASGRFSAAPLLVSGTDAYRGGEYLYQDYLFETMAPTPSLAQAARSPA